MIGWIGVGVAAGIVEAVGMRHHRNTLSELTARAFRVDTAAGKAAFTVALAVGALAYQRHIVRWEF